MFRSIDLHGKRTMKIFAPLAAAVLISAHPVAAQVGLGLSPMRVEIRLAPGACYTGSLRW